MMFVLLLSLTLYIFGQARETADVVLFHSDSTNFYQHITPNDNGVTRKVGIETVIPSIYSYCHDGVAVVVKYEDSSGNPHEEIFDTGLENVLSKYANKIGRAHV